MPLRTLMSIVNVDPRHPIPCPGGYAHLNGELLLRNEPTPAQAPGFHDEDAIFDEFPPKYGVVQS